MDTPLYHGAHDDYCGACLGKGILLCCDFCSCTYHPACLKPPLLSQPEEFWVCPHCTGLEQANGQQQMRDRCNTQESSSSFHRVQKKVRMDSLKKGGSVSSNHIYTSGYRGVYSRSGKWNAQIQYNGKKVYLGSYSSEQEAARAYDIAAKRYHGSKAVLNFQSSGEGASRNPFQMNSKPTSRHGSVRSGDDYEEPGLEYTSGKGTNMDMEDRQTNANFSSVITYASPEESESVLRDNRRECSL
ncbi:hypothetical protein JH06_1951 [Blastocystis sp. subtype 4]|uniref:hypothetical protein n=1 Tax=Blastocystis sp. subtype 4 TaxID=944170 RepID=UPI0007115D3C|nr:hypothetical protein JH06_1951 [Blastocystis sp. subtype 4]KNB44101.1 hypothetical protein JH06_1951 [Blastocystis sp. subtype 4]|eukprot:XP_014527544.1 hypothetical protein JH06_1951 [Blastocystis sp. subtype 4]